MRRFWAVFLMALLVANSFPLAAQARLICRMSGEEMVPVSVKEDPKSCCATRRSATGGVELANRSCCDLRITPGTTPLPPADLPATLTVSANLPTLTLLVPLPVLVEITPVIAPREQARPRGPPLLSSISPRGPPSFS